MEQNEKILALDLDREAQQEQEVDLEEELDLFPALEEENMEKESVTEERLPPIPNSSLNYLDPESNGLWQDFAFIWFSLNAPSPKS